MEIEKPEIRDSLGLSKRMVTMVLNNHYTHKQILENNPQYKTIPIKLYKTARRIKVTGSGRGGMITLFYAPDVDKFKPAKIGRPKRMKAVEQENTDSIEKITDDNWINIHQAVEIAPVTMGTIYHAAKIGKIQSKKVGRNRLFLKQSVELYEKNRNHNLSVPHPTYKRNVEAEPQKDRETGPMINYKETLESIQKANAEHLKDEVNHPEYYNDGKYEVIDVIEDWKLDFNAGNVIKYVARAKLKHTSKAEQKKDLQKALWYIQRMIDNLD